MKTTNNYSPVSCWKLSKGNSEQTKNSKDANALFFDILPLQQIFKCKGDALIEQCTQMARKLDFLGEVEVSKRSDEQYICYRNAKTQWEQENYISLDALISKG